MKAVVRAASTPRAVKSLLAVTGHGPCRDVAIRVAGHPPPSGERAGSGGFPLSGTVRRPGLVMRYF